MASYHSSKFIFGIALLTSGITAFYMFRLYYSIFWNKHQQIDDHHGEGSGTMVVPLIVLGLLSVGAGWLPFSKWLYRGNEPIHTHIDLLFSIAPVAFSLIGIKIANNLYRKPSDAPENLRMVWGKLYTAAYKKFYIDEMYKWLTQNIVFSFFGKLSYSIDKYIIDGIVNAIGNIVTSIYFSIRRIQSGKLQDYLLYFFGGIALGVIYFFYIWK